MNQYQLNILRNVTKKMNSDTLSKKIFYLFYRDERINNADEFIEKIEKLIEFVEPIDEKIDEVFDETQVKAEDFRFKALTLKGFRKFPYDNQYGILMSKKDIPCSLILLGGNGVGKSSLYNAIEYVLTKDITESKVRNCTAQNYIKHNNAEKINDAAERDLKVFTFNKLLTEVSSLELNQINSSAIFFSEGNILDCGKSIGAKTNKQSWNDFFLRSMGYGDCLLLIDYLTEYINKMTNNLNLVPAAFPETKPEDEKMAIEQELRKIGVQLIGGLSSTDMAHLQSYLEKVKTENTKLEKIENSVIGWDIRYVKLSDGISVVSQSLWDEVMSHIDNLSASVKEILSMIKSKKIQIFVRDKLTDLKTVQDKLKALKGLIPVENNGLNKRSKSRRSSKFQKPKIDIVSLCTDIKNIYVSLIFQLEELRAYSSLVVTYDQSDIFKVLNDRFAIYHSLEKQMTKYRIDENKMKDLEGKIKIMTLYRTTLINELANVISSLDKECIEFIKVVMSKFFIEPKEKLEILFNSSENGTVDIDIAIYLGDNEESVSVKNYFNTFRFRLFCVLLRVSIALLLMKKHNINLPLIFDDVFYASDYKNREQLSFFIEKLYEVSEKYIPSNKLQVIFFTHDELILEIFHQAMKSRNDIIYGRLYDCDYLLNEKYDRSIKFGGKNYDFKNLYVELFKYKQKLYVKN